MPHPPVTYTAHLAGLGLDDLSAAVLRALGERIDHVVAQGLVGLRLAKQGQDGDASMAADDGHVDVAHGQPSLFSVKCLGAHNVERGDAQDALGVVDALLLQYLCGDGDRGVDRVGDDVEQRLRAVLAASSDEVTHDARVDLLWVGWWLCMSTNVP